MPHGGSGVDELFNALNVDRPPGLGVALIVSVKDTDFFRQGGVQEEG
jgi:hypothetical protein